MSNTADEQELLASVNASLQDQNLYEDQVIRQATQQLAPQLTGIGLPPLFSLAPSYNARYPERYNPSDETHIFSILNSTRRKLQDETSLTESQQNHLQLKEQLLISFLSTVAGKTPDELPVRLEQERVVEQKRAAKLQQNEQKNDDEEPTARDVDKHQSRVTMIQRRTMQAPQHQEEEELKETVERKEQLRLLRVERQRRRNMRRAEETISIASSSTSEEEFDESADDEEEELPADESEQPVVDETNLKLDRDHVDDSTATASCPLCQTLVRANDSSQIDSVLAQHMNTCQQKRPSRRSNNRNAANHTDLGPTKTVSLSSKPRGKQRKRSTQTKRKPHKKAKVMGPKLDATDDLEEINYEDRVDDWIENGLSRMKEMKERDETEALPGAENCDGLYIPAWVNDRLFGYQRQGLHWMWNLHQQQVGGLIGDEMGLGKTVQVSSFLGILAGSRKLKSVLIIAPATMLQHWLNELAVWAPGLRRILIHQSGENDGISRSVSSSMFDALRKWLVQCRNDRLYEVIDDNDRATMDSHSFCGTGYVIVTTYESLRRNSTAFEQHNWSYVVLDEAQRIRNPDADITLACKRLKTPHRLALSGTPIQNDLRELWSLFDFVFPGRLGLLPTFEQEFADPIKRGGYSNASPVQVQLAYRCSLVLKDLHIYSGAKRKMFWK